MFVTEIDATDTRVEVREVGTGRVVGTAIFAPHADGWSARYTGRRKPLSRRDPETGACEHTDREAAISWIIAQEDNYRG